MSDPLTGPVEGQIIERLTRALQPDQLTVSNDSRHHQGHSGDDGSGESHFSLEIVASQFEGMNRLARQRAVNAALSDLLRDKIHALAIKARAPGE